MGLPGPVQSRTLGGDEGGPESLVHERSYSEDLETSHSGRKARGSLLAFVLSVRQKSGPFVEPLDGPTVTL